MKKKFFIMIQPLYLRNNSININKINELYNILLNKFDNFTLLIFNITNKKNKTFKKNVINPNLILYELKTNIIVGKYGMQYIYNNGIKQFLEIIKSY